MYTGTKPRMLDQPWERGCAKQSAVKGKYDDDHDDYHNDKNDDQDDHDDRDDHDSHGSAVGAGLC